MIAERSVASGIVRRDPSHPFVIVAGQLAEVATERRSVPR